MQALADGNAMIDEAAADAGRDPRAIRRQLNVGGQFRTDPSDRLLTGPPQQWAEQLAALALEHGVADFILASDDPHAIAVFGKQVAPAVRELVAAERAR